MSQTDPTPQLVERLLSSGLDHYGRNAVDDAVRCWLEVLQLQPGNPDALDYLDAAGVAQEQRVASATRPKATVVELSAVRQRLLDAESQQDDPGEMSAQSIAANVQRCVDKGQHEQALHQLYQLRARKPDDAWVTERIRHVRDQLLGRYYDTLGHLDYTPYQTLSLSLADLSVEQQRVLAHVNGQSSLNEIIEACPLGKLTTCRVLCQLLADAQLRVGDDTADRLSVERPVSVAPKPQVAQPASVEGKKEEEAPTTARSGGSYEGLFREATSAYLSRRYEAAAQLFEECLKQRPHDERVLHNLRRLQARL